MTELIVLSKSKELAKLVYLFLWYFDKNKFTYNPQMIRSSLSIPSNIAEGSQRDSKKEFIRFINIARGSLAELKVQMEILCDVEEVYLESLEMRSGHPESKPSYMIDKIFKLIDEVGRMTYNLKLKLRTP